MLSPHGLGRVRQYAPRSDQGAALALNGLAAKAATTARHQGGRISGEWLGPNAPRSGRRGDNSNSLGSPGEARRGLTGGDGLAGGWSVESDTNVPEHPSAKGRAPERQVNDGLTGLRWLAGCSQIKSVALPLTMPRLLSGQAGGRARHRPALEDGRPCLGGKASSGKPVLGADECLFRISAGRISEVHLCGGRDGERLDGWAELPQQPQIR